MSMFTHQKFPSLCSLVILCSLAMSGCKALDRNFRNPGIYVIQGESGHLTSIDGDKWFLDLKSMSLANNSTANIRLHSDFQLRITLSSRKESTVGCEVRDEFIDNIVRALPNGQTERFGSEDIWHWRALVSLSEPISEIQFLSKGKCIAQRQFNPPISCWPAAKAGLTLRSTRTPPALPSVLSQLPASSAPLVASVQAGPG